MFNNHPGAAVGTVIAVMLSLAFKLTVIIACGRYLGWW